MCAQVVYYPIYRVELHHHYLTIKGRIRRNLPKNKNTNVSVFFAHPDISCRLNHARKIYFSLNKLAPHSLKDEQ